MLIFNSRVLVGIFLLITQVVDTAQPRKTGMANVSGNVYDTLGRPIKNAVVRVYQEKNFVTEMVANEQGSFEFTGLTIGVYTFKVARKSGYGNSRSIDREISLQPGQNIIVDLIALNIPDHWPPLKSGIS